MTLTEDEAKTKRCQEGFWEAGGQRHVLNCIGSDCMAWRWDSDSTWKGPPQATRRADRNEWKGYCGKAGEP